MSKTIHELTELRNKLKAKITETSFVWKSVCLQPVYSGLSSEFGAAPMPIVASLFVEICEVVRVSHEGKEYYLPVTAKETREYAKKYNAFPLTRAVADQIYNRAKSHVASRPQSPSIRPKTPDPKDDPVFVKAQAEKLKDFEEQSEYLKKSSYKGIDDFGAHKLWTLSKLKIDQCVAKTTAACKVDNYTVNYGMYRDKLSTDATGKNEGGTFLKLFNPGKRLNQPLGGTDHDHDHWDYSQLLQLMRSSNSIPYRDEKGFMTYMDLKTALLKGHPLLWDEGKPLTAADLKF